MVCSLVDQALLNVPRWKVQCMGAPMYLKVFFNYDIIKFYFKYL